MLGKLGNFIYNLKHILNLHKVLIAIMFVFFLSLTWAYYSFIKATRLTFNNVSSSEIKNVETMSKIIEKNVIFTIQHHTGISRFCLSELLRVLSNNRRLKSLLDEVLSLYITKNIKYVYIIYKDKRGILRYLLDGSLPLSERGAFGQIFVPANTRLWKKCFKEKKDVYGIQNWSERVFGLWITYLHPILCKGKIQAVLVLDVSSGTYAKLEDILAPSRHYLNYMIAFTTVIILCIFLETLLLIKEQKKRRIDPLTGVYNRSYLRELEKTLDLKKIAVAMVDIDHFKKINDTYGHDYGDLALKNVAKQLMLYTRNYDLVIRYGGEEFLVIFRNYDGFRNKKYVKNIIRVAKRIQKKISANPVRVEELEIKLTVSIGLDPFTYKRKSLYESITMADKALYMAKRTGRNKVVVARLREGVLKVVD